MHVLTAAWCSNNSGAWWTAMGYTGSLPLSHSGCKSLWWGVIHAGSPSPSSAILCVIRRELQLLQIILDSIDPSFPLSILGSVVHRHPPRWFVWHIRRLLAAAYVRIISAWPSAPCLYHRLWYTGYSNDATNIITAFPMLQRKGLFPLRLRCAALRCDSER